MKALRVPPAMGTVPDVSVVVPGQGETEAVGLGVQVVELYKQPWKVY